MLLIFQERLRVLNVISVASQLLFKSYRYIGIGGNSIPPYIFLAFVVFYLNIQILSVNPS